MYKSFSTVHKTLHILQILSSPKRNIEKYESVLIKKSLAAFVRMCTFYVQYDSDTVFKEHVLKIYQITLQLSRYAYIIYLKSKNILG